MKVLLEDAIQTSQPSRVCVYHLGSQSSDTNFLSLLGASDFLALGSHEPKKLSTWPDRIKK